MKMYIKEMEGGIFINKVVKTKQVFLQKSCKSDDYTHNEYISKLYIQLKRPIFILCLSLVNDYHMAEDIMQETFIKVINNNDKFIMGSNAKAWIYTIPRNTSLNYLKATKREVLQEEIITEDNRNSCEEVLSSMEFLRMIEPLSLEEKQIVALRLSCNLGYFQISKILNISVVNLRKKYSRAIKKLKKINE